MIDCGGGPEADVVEARAEPALVGHLGSDLPGLQLGGAPSPETRVTYWCPGRRASNLEGSSK